jgi:hypothetical protein
MRGSRLGKGIALMLVAAVGTIPLAAAAPRYEFRAAGVPPQQEKLGARVPAYGG